MLGTARAAREQNPWISGFYESMWLGNFEAEWLTLPAPFFTWLAFFLPSPLSSVSSQEKQFRSPVLYFFIFETGSHLD